MLTKEALLAHLKQVVGDDSKDPWTDDNLPDLFRMFRPNGDGVEAALSVLPNASSYVARLLPVYRATKHEKWAADLYFVVRHPEPATESEVVALGQHFLVNLRRLAIVIGNDELTLYLASVTRVEVVPPDQLDYNCDGNSLVYDEVNVLFERHMLYEAYYHIACDRDLVYYLQWPFYEHLCGVDCFEPYFRLWQHGYSYAFDGSTLKLARR